MISCLPRQSWLVYVNTLLTVGNKQIQTYNRSAINVIKVNTANYQQMFLLAALCVHITRSVINIFNIRPVIWRLSSFFRDPYKVKQSRKKILKITHLRKQSRSRRNDESSMCHWATSSLQPIYLMVYVQINEMYTNILTISGLGDRLARRESYSCTINIPRPRREEICWRLIATRDILRIKLYYNLSDFGPLERLQRCWFRIKTQGSVVRRLNSAIHWIAIFFDVWKFGCWSILPETKIWYC